ncbi:E3 ubiquitin-protein ligase TRIM56 [Holothuria leucospilota]|uniref:E3 ubiquitin-protein ligase TRIM56 n=1 Tax=Holothuria leucospilota TaxID=206669 RepID=A0A9Q1BUC8_HOLLE|nr:E3 ubiquitin-protein ligase TRIM56 [Holothuria leucospilota]
MADKVVKDLNDDFLNCCICMTHFKTPKMLPCIHSFCQGCLEKYVSTKDSNKVPCPSCRKVFDLPESGVKGLQTNFHLVNLAEKVALLEKLTSPKENAKICDSCSSQEVAAFCFDCNFAICSKCKSHHALFPVLRSHTVVPVENVSDPKFHTEWKKATSPFCNFHPSEKLNFYCKTCSQLICRDCTIVQHTKPDHECTDAATQIESVKETLDRMLQKSNGKLTKAKNFVREGKQASEGVERATCNLETEIIQHYSKMIANITEMLQGQMASLIKTMTNFKNVKVGDIERQLRVAEDWIDRMKNTQDVTEKVIRESNPWEILGMSTDLKNAFDALQVESEEFVWCEPELQHGMTFKSIHVPRVDLGYFNYVPEVVVCDANGNFSLCHFDRPTRTIYVSIITIDSDHMKRENFPPYQLKHEIPKGVTVKMTAKRDGFLYVACGPVVVIFDCTLKQCSDEKCIYENDPQCRYVMCIEYSVRSKQVYIYNSEQNFELRSRDLEDPTDFNMNAPSLVKYLIPSTYDIIFGTVEDEISRYSLKRKVMSSHVLGRPLEFENLGVTHFLGGIRLGSYADPAGSSKYSDHVLCFFVWECMKKDPSNNQYHTWILGEYCTREKKFLGVLEGPKEEGSKVPAALFAMTTGNGGMEIHLCSNAGEVTLYERGKPKHEPIHYAEM